MSSVILAAMLLAGSGRCALGIDGGWEPPGVTAANEATARAAVADHALVDRGYFGTWQLNVSQSTFDNVAPPKASKRVHRDRGHGLISVVVDDTDYAGRQIRRAFVFRPDGRNYVMGLASATPRETIALTSVDLLTTQFVVRANEEIAATGCESLSADGRTMTIVTRREGAEGRHATSIGVWEKAARPDSEDEARVVLQVTDYARVPREYLLRAEEDASKIFGAIGVHVQWVDGYVAQPSDDRPATFSVIILSRRMVDLKCLSGSLADNALASSAKAAGRVSVFFTRTDDFATRHDLDRAQLLGTVIAHEVGHLLLPAHGHSSSGIMRAVWDAPGKRLEAFSVEQAAAIRDVLSAYGDVPLVEENVYR